MRDGRWASLHARLRADARRYGLRLRLEKYNPYGKAPVVTVTTRRPQALLASRALRQLQADLGIGGRRFDGAFLSVVGGGPHGLHRLLDAPHGGDARLRGVRAGPRGPRLPRQLAISASSVGCRTLEV